MFMDFCRHFPRYKNRSSKITLLKMHVVPAIINKPIPIDRLMCYCGVQASQVEVPRRRSHIPSNE